TQTAAPLENGLPGNRLGGIGSGLTFIGGEYSLALPDRGPNAKPYNACADNTTSYINRFQVMHMTLAPADDPDPAHPLPFTLTPMVVGTTLLWNRTPLVYGALCGLPNGAPALNGNQRFFFTGRSDGFDPSKNSLNAKNARFDPESIRVSPDRKHVY